MPARFDFATAARILFGAGAVREVIPAAAKMGRRALLVTGRSAERATRSLDPGDLLRTTVNVPGEPTVNLVRSGAQTARQHGCDLVISFGGGSAIDAGKAIAALVTNEGDPLDYIEVVGRGRTLANPSAPFIAVPTTAGTGSEVTRNAVLASTDHGVKASLRSPHMLPRLAVIDPDLTLDLPPALTAATGLDALTQLIEPYVSIRANALTDLYAQEGMRRAARSLERAYVDGQDRAAREDMALASLLGGLCLANAGLGAAHGFAAPIGGSFEAPHGAVCAALLPHVMAVNIRALQARGDAAKVGRYQTVAAILTGSAEAKPEDGIAFVRDLCHKLNIPPLAAYGLRPEHVPTLVANAAQASSMKANPLPLTPDEMSEILDRAI